jgi:hypothetical protein
MKIKVTENEVFFVGDKPWSRLASYGMHLNLSYLLVHSAISHQIGGFWLADISSFRSLTKAEEIEAKASTGEAKHILAKLNLAAKFFWALKVCFVLFY